ncbi:hypothetical membrane protein [Candidatus Protochlamydia naegleriophila]|uniref:Hypothetical membrane protein n=1 Tax=Candidatus Protochlamydia naegleriophila TaxID=389348 RepID=A0A0U5JBL3_9BACT|nr:hypothetical membrane protein [Candidatus Protochlamydia naegleriophila]
MVRLTVEYKFGDFVTNVQAKNKKQIKHQCLFRKANHSRMDCKKGENMGKMIGLWLLGVPIIIIILLKVFGII